MTEIKTNYRSLTKTLLDPDKVLDRMNQLHLSNLDLSKRLGIKEEAVNEMFRRLYNGRETQRSKALDLARALDCKIADISKSDQEDE